MSKTHMVVLGVLYERPMYAYEFKEIIEERGFEHWAGIQMRSIYKAIDTLRARGYLTSTLKIHSSTQNVNVYEVTDEGNAYLRKLVEKAFYNTIGIVDIWLAIAFMFATTRDYALKALRWRLGGLLKERVQDKALVDKLKSGEEFIPSNYQGLIKMSYEISFVMEKRFDEWIQNLEEGKERGFFIGEREG